MKFGKALKKMRKGHVISNTDWTECAVMYMTSDVIFLKEFSKGPQPCQVCNISVKDILSNKFYVVYSVDAL